LDLPLISPERDPEHVGHHLAAHTLSLDLLSEREEDLIGNVRER